MMNLLHGHTPLRQLQPYELCGCSAGSIAVVVLKGKGAVGVNSDHLGQVPVIELGAAAAGAVVGPFADHSVAYGEANGSVHGR